MTRAAYSLASYADVLRGSSRVPAPSRLRGRLRTVQHVAYLKSLNRLFQLTDNFRLPFWKWFEIVINECLEKA